MVLFKIYIKIQKNLQYLWRSGASTAAFPGVGSLSRSTTRTSLHLRLIPFILALLFLNLSFFACFCFCCSDSLRCLFGVFRPIWEIFTHLETITSERLATYGHLSVRGSLACHNYCDTGHPFIMVISEDLWHSQLMSSAWQWSCNYLF